MFRLTQALPTQPVGPLIKADQYSLLLDAQALVHEAHAKASEIIARAQEEYERQRQLGYEEGRQAAERAAMQSAVEHHQQMVRHLKQIENDVIELVVGAVTKIVGELDAADRIGRMVDVALAELVGQNQVTLTVHPQDVATVNQLLSGKQLFNGSATAGHESPCIEVQGDPRVALDTCIISTPKQVVDASLCVQLQELARILDLKSNGHD